MRNFNHCLGNLVISVKNDIPLSLLGRERAEYYGRFVVEEKLARADVQIKMKYSLEPFQDTSLHYSKIFSNSYSQINQTPSGFQILQFRQQLKRSPFLMVITDHTFSQFSYVFYPEFIKGAAGIKIDPYQFAADAFLLQHTLLNYQGLLIHAAGGAIDDCGLIFAAPSGTGKSTLSRLLYQAGYTQLYSEERLIVRQNDDCWNLWGTPWRGEGNIARNETAPLSALVFLTQADKTSVKELTSSDGLHRLLQVVSIPWYSKEWTNKGLAICETLIQDIPMYELAFRPDQTAVQAVEQLALSL